MRRRLNTLRQLGERLGGEADLVLGEDAAMSATDDQEGQLCRKQDGLCAEIAEAGADQDGVASIMAKIHALGLRLLRSVRMAVARRMLPEHAITDRFVVVVSAPVDGPGRGHVGPLALKPRVVPVLLEGEAFRHQHPVDESVSAILAGQTEDEIAGLRAPTDIRLAAGQGADPVEGVGRVAVVLADDVGKNGLSCRSADSLTGSV